MNINFSTHIIYIFLPIFVPALLDPVIFLHSHQEIRKINPSKRFHTQYFESNFNAMQTYNFTDFF